MPSSISSFILAITTSVAMINGYRSVEFAITLGFALIIMYDAAGLRQSAGKMGVVLNKIVDDYYTDKDSKQNSERLFALLGHPRCISWRFSGIHYFIIVPRIFTVSFINITILKFLWFL